MSEISEHCVHIVLLPTSREKLATVALAPLPNAQHMAHLKFTELTVVGPFRLWHPCRIFLRFSACERVSAYKGFHTVAAHCVALQNRALYEFDDGH